MRMNSVFLEYPILGIGDDYPASAFNATLTAQVVEGELVVNVVSEVRSISIEYLLASNQAAFCLEVSCGRTMVRLSRTFTERDVCVRLQSAQFSGKTEFELSIVAKERYRFAGGLETHTDYKDERFDLPVGSVLGYGGKWEVILDPYNGDIVGSNSIVQLDALNAREERVQVDLNQDQIVVLLPRETIQKFQELGMSSSKRTRDLILGSYIQLGLNAGMMSLVAGQDYNDECLWAEVLTSECRTKLQRDPNQLTTEEAVEFVSEMLGNPLTRLPQWFKGIVSEGDE